MKHMMFVFFAVFLLALSSCGKDVSNLDKQPSVSPGKQFKQFLQGDCPDGYVIESLGSICLCVSSQDTIQCPKNL
jgi:hypothetical protein